MPSSSWPGNSTRRPSALNQEESERAVGAESKVYIGFIIAKATTTGQTGQPRTALLRAVAPLYLTSSHTVERDTENRATKRLLLRV
jgi:hypothetical protein